MRGRGTGQGQTGPRGHEQALLLATDPSRLWHSSLLIHALQQSNHPLQVGVCRLLPIIYEQEVSRWASTDRLMTGSLFLQRPVQISQESSPCRSLQHLIRSTLALPELGSWCFATVPTSSISFLRGWFASSHIQGTPRTTRLVEESRCLFTRQAFQVQHPCYQRVSRGSVQALPSPGGGRHGRGVILNIDIGPSRRPPSPPWLLLFI